jgi:hypothetical protein
MMILLRLAVSSFPSTAMTQASAPSAPSGFEIEFEIQRQTLKAKIRKTEFAPFLL